MASIDGRIMDEREQIASDGEPLWSAERSVRTDGDEYFHNIPAEAAKLLQIEKSDDLEIDIYQDGYIVRPADS